MRITLAYNLRREESEEQAEWLTEEDVERLRSGLDSKCYEVTPLEVTLPPGDLVDGLVESRPDLDPQFSMAKRRQSKNGSVIVVVATDAPMLSQQLQRLSKRAALGLGRIGTTARTTSGEIVFAFSTGNRSSRERRGDSRYMNLNFVSDTYLNGLYEAAIEATEEAVLNAMLFSSGMEGQQGRYAWPLPTDQLVEWVGSQPR